MKNLLNTTLRSNEKSFTAKQLSHGATHYGALFFCSIILIFLFTGCQKQNTDVPMAELKTSDAKKADGNVVNNYTALSSQTAWELKQARAATARYRDIKNAIKDGYSNINVDVPNMGH